MTTKITEECINCGACEPECPNTAIYAGAVEYEWQGAKLRALSDDFYYIVPEKCTECVGFFDREACAAACPVDCCIPDPDCPETEEVLIARARVLHPDRQFAAEVPSRFRKAERDEPLPARVSITPAQAAAAAAGAKPAPAPTAAAEPGVAEVVAVLPPAAATAAAAVQKAVAAPAAAAAAQKPVAAPAAAAAVQKPVAAPAAAKAVQQHVAAPAAAVAKSGDAPDEAPVARTAPAAATRRATDTANFDRLRDAVCGPSAQRPSLLARLARRLGAGDTVDNGSTGFDGFTSAAFESKRERERRYGEVYRVEEHPGGYYVRLEMPRTVPPSAAKERLGIGDEMPDYDFDVTLLTPDLTINGHVAEQQLRALCGVSSAFPPDFRTSIRLAGELAGLGYRYSGKVLEIIVSRRDDAARRSGA